MRRKFTMDESPGSPAFVPAIVEEAAPAAPAAPISAIARLPVAELSIDGHRVHLKRR
jgi:hypothetical protein